MRNRIALLATMQLAAMAMNVVAYDVRTPALSPVTFKQTPAHADVKLVENGALKFAIITDKKAEKGSYKSILPAGELLQEAFEKCTGKKPEIFDVSELDNARQYPFQLLLGDSELTRKLGLCGAELPPEGFEVKSFAGGLAIVGYDSSLIKDYNSNPLDHKGALCGTLWGAYDFVERFLGCRFYFPGASGSLWPKTTDLSVAPVDYVDYPRFANRCPWWITWTMMGEKNKEKWEPLLGAYIGKTIYPDAVPFPERWRLAYPIPFHPGHDPDPKRFLERFPNEKETIFYRAPNGNLYYNDKAHIGNYFDVTNLKFADLMVEALKEYYASNGKVKSGWGYQPNSSFINFGQCDTGLPLPDIIDNPTVRENNLITAEHLKSGRGMSDVYGRFHQYLAERLKQELPGKKLAIMPYSDAQYTPMNPKWRLPDNVELRVALHMFPGYTRNPAAVERGLKIMREWYEAIGNRPILSIWLYNVPDGSGSVFARAVAPHFIGEVPKILGKYLGRNDMFFDQYGPLDWSFYYSQYAAHRSMWNPDFDCDAAVAEHWEPMYGPAAPFLKEFHALLMSSFLKYYVPNEKDRNPLYPPPVIDKLEALLKQADEALKPDSVEMKRFKLFAAPWAKAIEQQRSRQGYERPVYGAHQLLPTESVNIDGKPDDAVWEKIKPVELRDPYGSKDPVKFPATLKLAWDTQGVYGLALMPYAPLADPKLDVWTNCNWELFVSPGLEKANMYHYAVDALNHHHLGTKEFAPVDKQYDANWKSPNFKAEATRTDKNWTMEFFLPFEDMKIKPPAPYDCWLANFVRNKNAEPKEYSGSAMTLGNNHNIGMFGVIKFLGKGD